MLDNFDKLASIFENGLKTNTTYSIDSIIDPNNFLIYEIFSFILPIVFIDLEQSELNFDNEEVKQEYDYRKKFLFEHLWSNKFVINIFRY